MKSISINEVIDAFGDQPASVGDRLKALGAGEEEMSKFSPDLLSAKVYASSFVKFLQDNKDRFEQEVLIPAKELPEGWKDPFEEGEKTVFERFVAVGFSPEEVQAIFNQDVLNLQVTPDEFQSLLQNNQDRLFVYMDKLASNES